MDRRGPRRRGPSDAGALSLIERRESRDWATFVIQFLAGVICAPFLLTGFFRLTPFAWPLWVPLFPLLGLVLVLSLRPATRAVAAGLLGGSIAWVPFVLWLASNME